MNYDRRQTIDHTHYEKRTTNFFVVRFSIEDSLCGVFSVGRWQPPILPGGKPTPLFYCLIPWAARAAGEVVLSA